MVICDNGLNPISYLYESLSPSVYNSKICNANSVIGIHYQCMRHKVATDRKGQGIYISRRYHVIWAGAGQSYVLGKPIKTRTHPEDERGNESYIFMHLLSNYRQYTKYFVTASGEWVYLTANSGENSVRLDE